MNTKKVQKKRQKKRHFVTCVFSSCSLGADIVIEKKPHNRRHIFYIARGVSRRRRRELWQRLRERERERDPVVATLKRKREKGGLLLLENFNGAHRKKNVSTTVSSFLILQKLSFVASNARLRRKGVDKRSRFTAPPTVPTVLDDESAVSSSRGAFFCRDVQ